MMKTTLQAPQGLPLVFVFLLLCILPLLLLRPSPVEAGSTVQLKGSGSSQSGAIYSVWVKNYRFYRDVVRLSYDGSGTNGALRAYTAGTVDFVATERGLSFDDYIQFPVAGQGIVFGYNLPTLNYTDPTLILNRTVLGSIWAGSVSNWNDTAIRELNPDIRDKLPNSPILLGYSNDTSKPITFLEILKLTLESFSDEFRDAFEQANSTFSSMKPALEGRSVRVGGSSTSRINWLQATPNGLTWLNFAGGIVSSSTSSVNMARLVNKAGNVVQLSVQTLLAAMSDFQQDYQEGSFGIDIYDAPGPNSWPMAYLTFFAMQQNQTKDDCSNVGELLDFVAWIHTNDEASVAAEESLVAPLDVSFKKKLLSLLNNVRCNGKKAFATSVLVGTGGQLALVNAWSTTWATNQYYLKYYQTSPATARDQLAKRNIDFGVPLGVNAEGWNEVIPSAVLSPLAAYPLVPAYNIPELDDQYLVLNADVIAAIYLNEITVWNDSRIKSINPSSVASLLPFKPIVVVLENITAAQIEFTTWLNATVPRWSSVGVGLNVHFPVVNTKQASSEDDFIDQMISTSYSFAIWPLYDIRQARTLGIASLRNAAGNTVRPTLDSVMSAMKDYDARIASTSSNGVVATPAVTKRDIAPSSLSLLNGQGRNSWPLTTLASVVYSQTTSDNCDDARALADFVSWTQLDEDAEETANKQGYVLASGSTVIRAELLNQLKAMTCDGVTVSAYANCIYEGELCSGLGNCTNGVCACPSTRTGQYCEEVVSSDSTDVVAIVLATVIPFSVALFCLLVLFLIIIIAVLLVARRRRESHDWEIRYDEIDFGEQIGCGGYGQVYRATWKGTEVAVKVMMAPSEKMSKEVERNFKEEVRVMTALRHPNVVLFMAACTRPPKMCIVMEFMSLGSLHELLHNELVPEIPFALKAKMAYQASKGMHFLHSSGIVHRDLKSLNLLLDHKWNVKVSDFGLTGFKEEIRKGGGREAFGSVHWTAPEVLNESPEPDLVLADVYSFGIILWELHTRQQPYIGLSPAAVAVAVIRDGLRPEMPESDAAQCPPEYEELITSCWHQDPTVRPTFLEIMTRLSTLHGDSSVGGMSMTSKTSTSSSGVTDASPRGSFIHRGAARITKTLSTMGSEHSSSSSGSSAQSPAAAAGTARGTPPEGELCIVFSDITRAASLWEFNAAAMRDATLLHNQILRAALTKHRGYEVAFLRDKNSGEGSFCMAFQQVTDALEWCCSVQLELLKAEWPEALLEHPGAAEEWGDTDDRILFKGLRIRMGVHYGAVKSVRDPMTRRVEYIGPVVNTAARITAMTHGGQVVLSQAVHAKLQETPEAAPRLVSLGNFEMPDSPSGAKLYELKVEGLEGRFFGGVDKDSSDGTPDEPNEENEGFLGNEGRPGNGLQSAVGEGLMFKEDTFLTSANLCRYIINFNEIQLGKQIGLGSYGVVFRGKWKGVDVAVKRFIKQKIDERRMLEFRAEMAFLSELHHPNIVLFIGACVKKPNLCIVTEYMKQGSLKDILSMVSVKLTWKQKLRLLRSAALGINYLHSLQPIIVHRDLKPSNLLVDENWNVKVADFGFARIKEENATMTRCGTPCWTAPEIIRGEKYNEKVDVFSFGIIMWQVATRKEPFAGRNFMGVSLDVLEGRRPQIPGDMPIDFKKLMKKCWHASPSKRPLMEDVLAFFDRQVGDDAHNDLNQP